MGHHNSENVSSSQPENSSEYQAIGRRESVRSIPQSTLTVSG